MNNNKDNNDQDNDKNNRKGINKQLSKKKKNTWLIFENVTASTLNQSRFKNPARSIYERFSFSIKIIIYNHHYYLFYYFYLLTISLK